jgi:hypothetical protein
VRTVNLAVKASFHRQTTRPAAIQRMAAPGLAELYCLRRNLKRRLVFDRALQRHHNQRRPSLGAHFRIAPAERQLIVAALDCLEGDFSAGCWKMNDRRCYFR